jgi:hypothetical protein
MFRTERGTPPVSVTSPRTLFGCDQVGGQWQGAANALPPIDALVRSPFNKLALRASPVAAAAWSSRQRLGSLKIAGQQAVPLSGTIGLTRRTDLRYVSL